VKVGIGISGGVDSAVAALLLRDAGHEVVGVTMTLGREGEDALLEQARSAAKRLGIGFHSVDLSREWRREVLDYIASAYMAGDTPNPCVKCNESVKMRLLPEFAFGLGCEMFATGHYARIEGGRLLRGIDRRKDQSYFLYRVPRDILARTILPLGTMTKEEVRAEASRRGVESCDKGDSQDFCGGDVRTVVGASPREGNIVTPDGRVLGRHQGFWNYTVGMRKGLGIGGGTPFYVIELRAGSNEVVVAPKEFAVKYDLSLCGCTGEIDKTLPVKVRSAGEPRLLKDGIAGIAPGQSAVFYRGDEVVGGGIICR
jgi:tRNA-specific 2-thiouridylase